MTLVMANVAHQFVVGHGMPEPCFPAPSAHRAVVEEATSQFLQSNLIETRIDCTGND